MRISGAVCRAQESDQYLQNEIILAEQQKFDIMHDCEKNGIDGESNINIGNKGFMETAIKSSTKGIKECKPYSNE